MFKTNNVNKDKRLVENIYLTYQRWCQYLNSENCGNDIGKRQTSEISNSRRQDKFSVTSVHVARTLTDKHNREQCVYRIIFEVA